MSTRPRRDILVSSLLSSWWLDLRMPGQDVVDPRLWATGKCCRYHGGLTITIMPLSSFTVDLRHAIPIACLLSSSMSEPGKGARSMRKGTAKSSLSKPGALGANNVRNNSFIRYPIRHSGEYISLKRPWICASVLSYHRELSFYQ